MTLPTFISSYQLTKPKEDLDIEGGKGSNRITPLVHAYIVCVKDLKRTGNRKHQNFFDSIIPVSCPSRNTIVERLRLSLKGTLPMCRHKPYTCFFFSFFSYRVKRTLPICETLFLRFYN